jgi:hypothetical protein
MTVLDATNLLYEWYQTNSSFEVNRDIKTLIPVIDDEEVTHSALKLALVELEGNNLIASQAYGEKTYYILTKPYDAYQQGIELTSWTSKWLSGEINEFCNLIEDNTDLCNASQVQDKDIRNLVHIIQFYKNKVMEKEEIISSMSNHTGSNGEDMLSALLSLQDKEASKLKDEGDKSDEEDGGSDDDEDEGKNKKNKKKK